MRCGLLRRIAVALLCLSASAEAQAPPTGRFAAVKHLGPAVNSPFGEYPGSVSADGRTLFLHSTRPWAGELRNLLDRLDIYTAERDAAGAFGEAVPVRCLNTPEADATAFLTLDGRIFFSSNRDGGNWDLWVATRGWPGNGCTVELLPGPVNSAASEVFPSLTCRGDTLFFMALDRAGRQESFDVWMATLKGDAFGEPVNLGSLEHRVNTPDTESAPSIACDGRTLFFSDESFLLGTARPSGFGGDNLWMSTQNGMGFFEEPVNLGPPLSSQFHDAIPVIAPDWPASGAALYFASDRPHPLAEGDFDIYQATWLASGAGIVLEDEPPRTRGAINCAGPTVDATAEVGFVFEEDRFLDDEVGFRGDPRTGFTVIRAAFGRVPDPSIHRGENPRPVNVSRINDAGAETAKLFASDTRSTQRLHYQAPVVPGRYRVVLFFAEVAGEAVNGLGQGTRLITASLNGENVLCNWSAAAAAGSSGGSGDPSSVCAAVLDTAIAREFSMDIPSTTLDVVVQGAGTPASEPSLSAIAFERVGAETGEGLLGVECLEAGPPLPGPMANEALEKARERWRGPGELFINSGGPMLACGARQNPALEASEDAGPGEEVVWVEDLAAGLAPAENEFFVVTPAESKGSLEVADTDMGFWDARGTASPQVDANDRIFHTERRGDVRYDIPVVGDVYEVTLYFANTTGATAGTAQRFFSIAIEEDLLDGFTHCEASGRMGDPPAPVQNPLLGFDSLYDPVDHAERLYAPVLCGFLECASNGVAAAHDPDGDGIPADRECGNAAATALRLDVPVDDGLLTIALTGPDVAAGDPAAPDMSPGIAGLAVRRRARFLRGNADGQGPVDITDAVFTLSHLFQGGETPPCMEAADANRDETVNITDSIFTLGFLFLGGPGPPPPFPACEVAEAMDCEPFATEGCK